MKKERRKLKSIVFTGALQGLVFASLMAVFDYFSDEKEFSLTQFIFCFLFFGGIMAFVFRNKFTKE